LNRLAIIARNYAGPDDGLVEGLSDLMTDTLHWAKAQGVDPETLARIPGLAASRFADDTGQTLDLRSRANGEAIPPDGFDLDKALSKAGAAMADAGRLRHGEPMTDAVGMIEDLLLVARTHRQDPAACLRCAMGNYRAESGDAPALQTFDIPCIWEMCGAMQVEAASLEEAVEKADDMNLPKEGEYVSGSFQVNRDVLEENAYLEDERKSAAAPRAPGE
jgi:hypothetical protein